MLTETQVKVVMILLDEKGHAEWELAEYLDMEDSNLNPILKELERMGITYQGEARISSKQRKRKGDYKEFPYYLGKNLDNLKTMIREMAEGKKVYDFGFILGIIKYSRYIKSMRKKFKKDLNKSVAEVLRTSYPP
jgi:predicted transcriptional regulator